MTKERIAEWISQQIEGLDPEYMHITLRKSDHSGCRHIFCDKHNRKRPEQTREEFYQFLRTQKICKVWIYIDPASNLKNWPRDGHELCSSYLDEP